MVLAWQFLLLFLWVYSVVSLANRTSVAEHTSALVPRDVLFAPECLLPSDCSAVSVLKHFRPTSPRHHHSLILIPGCHWLILLAGNVETNPGPLKYPCSVCNKSVRCNQRGLCYVNSGPMLIAVG